MMDMTTRNRHRILLLIIGILSAHVMNAQYWATPTDYDYSGMAEEITAGATGKYEQAEKIYRHQMAGILSRELSEGIPCPVCGSVHHPNPAKIEEKITPRTKGIIGVHLCGQPFDYAGVKAIADKHGLFVVEDCAQSHGAMFEGRNVGTLGELACFSFYPGKNLYAFGEGGSVTCEKEEYFKHMTRLKNQGCDVRYYHDEIGYNYRLEGLQGAVLSVSLKYLPQWTKRRQEIGERYIREITNPLFTMQAHPENTEPVYHLFVVQLEERDRFVQYMADNNVECNLHYPVPCHLQNAYAHLGYKKGDCPNAEQLAAHCVTLPLFPGMREDEVDRVISLCNDFR